MTMFLRPEVRVWDDLDVESFITFTAWPMKSIDIHPESAVKLIVKFCTLILAREPWQIALRMVTISSQMDILSPQRAKALNSICAFRVQVTTVVI